MVVPGIGRNLFSVMKAGKKGIVVMFYYESTRLEGFDVAVQLQSESDNLYSVVPDLSTARYGAKERAINAVDNAQMWHRWLDRLHA